MNITFIESLVLGTIGIILTAYYSWHTKKISHEQMLKQLFKEFNERYDLLNEHLLKIEREYPNYVDFNKNNNIELRQKVIDYFNLCAEEYFWYRHKKRIDKVIWRSWHAGMNYWYRLDTIKKLWKKETENNGRISYYLTNNDGFFDE